MNLVLCPSCERQYDVTSLPAGVSVRCLCDTLFPVSARRELRVQALRCGGCGAPAGAEDSACTFCGAALSARDRQASTLCPKCFARLADDARHCKACGVAIRPQALTPIPDGRSCPRCQGALRIRALEDVHAIECVACAGLWLRRDVFELLLERARASAAGSLPRVPPAPGAASPVDPVRYVPCLTCGELMFRHLYRRKGRSSKVIVDLCRDHGLWLDTGELETLHAFVRGLASVEGADERPVTGPSRSQAPSLRPEVLKSLQGRRSFFDRLVDGLIGLGDVF